MVDFDWSSSPSLCSQINLGRAGRRPLVLRLGIILSFLLIIRFFLVGLLICSTCFSSEQLLSVNNFFGILHDLNKGGWCFFSQFDRRHLKSQSGEEVAHGGVVWTIRDLELLFLESPTYSLKVSPSFCRMVVRWVVVFHYSAEKRIDLWTPSSAGYRSRSTVPIAFCTRVERPQLELFGMLGTWWRQMPSKNPWGLRKPQRNLSGPWIHRTASWRPFWTW